VKAGAMGLLGDLAGALLVVWLVPMGIIVVGVPVALAARMLIEFAQRF